MIGDSQGGETGFSISGNGAHGDIWRTVKINCKDQMVNIVDKDKTVLSKSFIDFISTDLSEFTRDDYDYY